MKTVLVAIDKSESALRAAHVAADHAACFGSALDLLHVVTLSVIPPDLGGASQEAIDWVMAEGAALLARTAAALARPGLVIRTTLKVGSTGKTILEVADAQSADLVVVGRGSHGAVARAVLGSVADWVAHHCRQPVLLAG